jgi:hypothetical protein
MRHPLILAIACFFAARSLTLGIQAVGEIRPIMSAEKERELLQIVAFCLIGLLVTFGFMVRYPDLGAVIAEYNQF